MANQPAINLIQSTVDTFNINTTSVSATDGISLLDHWLSALRSEESDAPIPSLLNTLSELKMQLQEGNSDTDRIKFLLNQLADQTEEVTQSEEDDKIKQPLNALVQTLRDFGQVIAGETGNLADKHGRAQLFTQTGTGSAAGNPGVNPAVPGTSNTGEEGVIPDGGATGEGDGHRR